MLPRNHLDRIQIACRRPPPGGQRRPAPSSHLGPAPRPFPTGAAAPGPGRCAGPGQHRRQDADSGRLRAGGRRLHRRRRCTARRWDGRCSRLHGQGAIHPGHFPAQLPVGLRPPTGPGEPRVAGTGMAGRSRTRRRALDHRPRIHRLRDLRTGQGGSATPRLYRQAGLSPTAGRRRRHRRGADVPSARGPGHHRPPHRPLPA